MRVLQTYVDPRDAGLVTPDDVPLNGDPAPGRDLSCPTFASPTISRAVESSSAVRSRHIGLNRRRTIYISQHHTLVIVHSN